MKNIKILVCCHKETERLHDSIFTPILQGAEFADDALKKAFREDLLDNTGDNIGRLHPYSAELTSIYWAWKNYDQLGDPDYIGLHHYRRFLNFREPLNETDNWKCAFFDFDEATCRRFGWDRESIEAFCEGAELILPLSEQITDPYDWVTPADLETHYKHSHYPEDLDTAAAFIRETHPDYASAVDTALHSGTGYFCNMFLMKRELFLDYAEWLFSILLPLADRLPVTDPKYKGEQKRVLGFLGERLFNVWITKQAASGVQIKETQRLTGYLTEADKKHYQKTYGMKEYARALSNSKRYDVKNTVFDRTANADNVIVHESRTTEIPDVSILVPVYNVGPFLRECCESLVNQTLRNIEIVFVNDASTDDSPSILWEYYERDPRIVLLEHKKNQGLPCARNTAFGYMRGRYFSCIDSDDVCDLTMFEKLFNKAEELSADIVTCSVFGFFDNTNEVYYHRQLEWYGDSDKVLSLKGRPQQLMEPAAWCKLFRTEYVRGLDYFEFRPGTRSWEDVPAMTSAFCQTERIATVQEALYFYRQRREGNISSSMTRRNTDEFISGAILQQEILDRHHFFDEEVQSYIEEFKFLFAEWSLTKMKKSDIPYFFHRVPSLFKKEDVKYLDRVFTIFPHRKRFYKVLMTRSATLYYLARFGYHTLVKFQKGLKKCLRGIKKIIKKIFNIRRDDVYWAIGYGALTLRFFRKSYYEQSIAWYRDRANERNAFLENNQQLNGTVAWLDGRCRELEAQNSVIPTLNRELDQIRAANGELEETETDLRRKLARLEEESSRLEEKSSRLEEDRRKLTGENDRLTSDIRILENLRDSLTADCRVLEGANTTLSEANKALESSNQHLFDTNAQMTRTCEELNESFRLLMQDKAALDEERKTLRASLEQETTELSECRSAIDSLHQEFDGYYHAVWATGWIKVWKDYYYENYARIPQKTKRLEKGLDESSVETIRLICKRNFELLPTQENTELYRFHHYSLYTPSELAGAKELPTYEEYRGKFYLPENAEMETPVWHFHCGLQSLPRTVLNRIRGKAVIDGGAYWGDSALVFSEYSPSAIYAFEPQPENHAKLTEVVEKNGMGELIFPQMAGLSDHSGTAPLYTNGMNSGANLFDVNPVIQESVKRVDTIDLVTVDGFVKDNDLHVGLIKLDVEGNESQVIAGAMETIRRDKPILLISIYHTPKDFFDIKPLLEKEKLGYRFMVRKLSFHDLVTEVMLIGYVD